MRVMIELAMRQPARRDVCYCNFRQDVAVAVQRVALLASFRIQQPLSIFNAEGDPLVRVACDLRRRADAAATSDQTGGST